jgi:formate hydrogenlyase subunit 3/multisubunit Na+/H+ antiporter MnhD subunit
VIVFLVAIGLLLAGGAFALAAGASERWVTRLGVGGALAGCALGGTSAVRVLASSAPLSLRIPWDVPFGSFYIEIDALSAFFLLVVFVVSAVAALYGGEYLAHASNRHGSAHGGEASSAGRPKPLGSPWFFYDLLVASMAIVIVARNGVLFLVAWEVMALASFFLVTHDDDEEAVRDAGLTYLVATHLGTAFLMAAFALLGREAGSLDFDRIAALGVLSPTLAGTLFLLGLVGFGAKAGVVPFHVWLPEAHPAAPSHVSAVMSGAMIKVGIYALLRLLALLGPPAVWWGGVLVGVGLASGVVGALFAVAQHDLKRLLAYSSVENVGIITVGIGLGVIGITQDAPAVAALGFAGALLHVANHALFKSLLFLGAGAVAHAAGTRSIDRLGGLLRRMPATGSAFLIGATAICALPPLNGFASEFLVYLAALRAGTARAAAMSLPALATIAGLALIGGLAAVAFAKAFGVAFLGEPRTPAASAAREPGALMRLATALLAIGCVAAGLGAPWLVAGIAPVIEGAIPLPRPAVAETVSLATRLLFLVTLIALAFLAIVAALVLLRRALLGSRPVARAATWGCGYARPTPRMQYTGSSFAQPLAALFHSILRTRRRWVAPTGPFPREAALETATPDAIDTRLFRPLFAGAARGLSRLRWLQHGRLNLYMLYIALTLVVLLIWKMG